MHPALRCLLVIASYAAFLYSGTNGNLWVQGDDVWFLSRFNTGAETYLHRLSTRFFLTPFYTWLYDLCGHSLPLMHWFFFGCHLLAGGLCFAALRRALGDTGATFAALFLLSYTGISETVTWLSAGCYLIVLCALFASIWIAIAAAPWDPWLRGAAIAAINWPVVHLYELGIAAAPLYPALTLLWLRLRRQPVSPGILLPTLLPLAMFCAHWLLMIAGTPAGTPYVWMRNPVDTSSGGLLRAVSNAVALGLDASAGPRLLEHARVSREAFFTLARWSPGVVAAAVAAIAGLVWLWRRASSSPVPNNEASIITLAGGLYLWILTPAVGMSVATVFMPPRLVTFSAAGLAALFGLAMTAAARWSNRRGRAVVWGAGMFVLVAQAAAFHGMLVSNQDAWAFDSRIRQQLSTFAPWKPGDSIFLSLPFDPRMAGPWRINPSQFESGQILPMLINDAGLLAIDSAVPRYERLRYFKEIHWHRNKAIRFPIARMASAAGRFFPFYWREQDQKLVPIRSLRLVDSSGATLSAKPVPAFAGLADGVAMEAAAVPVEMPEIDIAAEPRQIYLHHYDATLRAVIGGPIITTGKPFDVELVQNGSVRARHHHDGADWRFEFTVPLSALDPASTLWLRNATPGIVWRAETLELARSQP